MTIIDFLSNEKNKSELKGKQIVVRGAESPYWWDNTDKVLEKVGISIDSIYLYVI